MCENNQKKAKFSGDKIKESGWTYEDYAKLPEDDKRYEISDGILELLAPSPSGEHQVLATEIGVVLKNSCKNDYIIVLAPIDLILSDKEVRQPDIVMIHQSKKDIIEKRGIVDLPDLVVEILSPSSVRRDKVTKKNTYANYGIREYWIADPVNLYIEQYILNTDSPDPDKNQSYVLHNVYTGEDIITSPYIPCISFTIDDLDTL